MRAYHLDRIITIRQRNYLGRDSERGEPMYSAETERKLWAARVLESAANDLEAESARL